MSGHLRPDDLREIRTLDDVLELLVEDLDWPIEADDLEEATFDWDPEELGLPADRVPHLVSLRQLRPLETHQPWGIFFLEFDGPRLPLTALRQLLSKLVTKKRATGGGNQKTWSLDDLLFIITTDSGDSVELHFLAFRDSAEGPAEVLSIPWRPGQSPTQHLHRIATELLPHLAWPDDPAATEAWRSEWRAAFKLRHGEVIKTVSRLVERMASTARQIRERIDEALVLEGGDGPFTTLMNEVRDELLGSVTPEQFADMCAQTLTYGALTGRVTDPEAFGATPTLSSIPLANPFLTAFFEQVHDQALQLGGDDDLEQLVADLKASQVEAILDQFGSTARGGDPVVHFYEEFLTRYDPEMRVQAGAFYTPQPAVRYMVRTCDQILRTRLGLPLGAADGTSWGELATRLSLHLPGTIDPASPFVSMLDPATGTGTFLVEWLRQAKGSFEGGGSQEPWAAHARAITLPNVHALELMLAPYAVAHLKIALELHDDGVDDAELGIYLTDTLQRVSSGQLSLEPDAISVEGERADTVKRNLRATVCVGNPPYDRVAKEAGGGWITDDAAGHSLFDDILQPAKDHTIFSHQASLYNKFVYFWRWSLWKVFEDRPDLPGVVCLITPSSWLTGPGFLGLRQLARELGDEIWVTDLGGDNRGTRKDENIFEIETPVAIVAICRSGMGDRSTPARVRYRRIEGTAAEKLAVLGGELDPLSGDGWVDSPDAWHDSFIPHSGEVEWQEYPALIDLFPWQQPGCKYGRTWPISPDRDVLPRRWARLVETDDPTDREVCFVTPSAGRNIYTRVGKRTRVVDLPVGAPPPPVVRYGFRSFDRQFAFDDPRMTKTESPSLWAASSPTQVFMASMPTAALGRGSAASASAYVPDLHYFCGRGGKDVIPLYRDESDTPNADAAMLETLAELLEAGGLPVEDLFAYTYAVLAGTDYTDRFSEELETPGPRVPLTAERALFDAAADFGRELLWLHTYGERFDDPPRGPLRHPEVTRSKAITELPATLKAVSYDSVANVLTVSDGAIAGVTPDVWEFEVSGMRVVRKWLGYRTAKPAGKAASSTSPLDAIRPTTWPPEWTEELLDLLSILRRTIDLRPRGIELLDAICSGPLIAASDLPPVDPALREPPATPPPVPSDGLGL